MACEGDDCKMCEGCKEELDESVVEAAALNAANFGAAETMFVPGYGQIVYKGKLTENGIAFFRDNFPVYADKLNGVKE